jgi:tetratricopeptide (TPR) repeat protein
MTDQAPRPPAVAAPRVRLRWLVLFGAGAAAAVIFWSLWGRSGEVGLPELSLADADPEFIAAADAAIDQVRRHPHSVEAWTHLAKLLRACDYREQSAVCFAKLARLDPENPRWPYLQGEAISQTDPEAAVPILQRAAELADRRGENVLAARFRLIEVAQDLGRDDLAEAELAHVARIEPDHPFVQLNLGLLALARDDLKAGLEHLLRCQDSPSTQKKACEQLAMVYERLGDKKSAAKFSRQARGLKDSHWGDSYLVECLQHGVGNAARFRQIEQAEAQGRYGDAARLLQEIVQTHPDFRSYFGLGRARAQLGKFDEAADALRNALKLRPENLQAQYYLAKVLWARADELWNKKNLDEARSGFEEAARMTQRLLQEQSDHPLAYVVLGLCQKRLGRRKEALATLQQAVANGPEITDTWLNLGEMLAEEGRTVEARASLQQAERLAKPGDRRARTALEQLDKK